MVERLEASAWIEMTKVGPPARSLETRSVDGALLIVDRSLDQPVNRAFLLGIDKALSERTLTGITEAFAERGIEAFSTCLLPIARPTHAPRLLEQFGFKRGPKQAAVVRHAGDVQPADQFFRIRAARPEDAAAVQELMVQATADPVDWTRVVSGLIASDHCRFHLAHEGSRPYAMGGFFFNGDTAFLFTRNWVLPGYETRGVQTALIQTVLEDAKAQGCRWVVSIYPMTAETRVRRFQRIGFEVIFQRRFYFYGQEPEPEELNDPLSRSIRE
jgi:GNAT superfamily N-acetyltransferase